MIQSQTVQSLPGSGDDDDELRHQYSEAISYCPPQTKGVRRIDSFSDSHPVNVGILWARLSRFDPTCIVGKRQCAPPRFWPFCPSLEDSLDSIIWSVVGPYQHPFFHVLQPSTNSSALGTTPGKHLPKTLKHGIIHIR
mmetsp:Transcript_9691/g.26830  ORF Transcript_9691/g.26830 Transcript_9691/m.26830 type:complete len:138 (+) Transcript_9691:588-1001(+)